MPFKRDFERRVNEDLAGEKEEQPSSSAKAKEAAMEEEDEEILEKYRAKLKEAPPPRFSTLYHTPPPSRDLSPSTPVLESYTRSRRRSAGVFVPMPLLIMIAVLFVFEGIVLFAYTIIGLYNTTPSQVLGLMNIPTGQGSSTCNCLAADNQPAQAPINISPNFVIPQAGLASQLSPETEIITTTVTATPSINISSMASEALGTITMSSIGSNPSSTSSLDSGSQASQAASNILSLLMPPPASPTTSSPQSPSASAENQTSETSSSSELVSTYTPRPTISSTKIVYVDGSGDTGDSQSSTTTTTVVTAKRSAAALTEPNVQATSDFTEKGSAAPNPTPLLKLSLEEALS